MRLIQAECYRTELSGLLRTDASALAAVSCHAYLESRPVNGASGASASATAEPPHFVGRPAPPGRAPRGIRCQGLRGPRPAIAAWLTGRSAAGRTSFLPGGCAPRGAR